MEFFNELTVFNQVMISVTGVLLIVCFISWLLSEGLGYLIHKHQRKIYKGFTHYATLDELARDQLQPKQSRPLLLFFMPGNVHQVLADVKINGVMFYNVDCGYLISDDVGGDVFDEPFNKYLTEVLIDNNIFNPTEIDEVEFMVKVLNGNGWLERIRDLKFLDTNMNILSQAQRHIRDRITSGKDVSVKKIHELHAG